MPELYRFTPGATPLLISVPHAGTHVPPDIGERLTPAALTLADTDWHVDRLYEFAAAIGAGLLTATHSRYVIDLNRDPAGVALYPDADNTELVPLTTFAHEAIYAPGREPDDAEKKGRIAKYWEPYHAKLRRELDAIRSRFGVAILWDGHSIPSEVPRFFKGSLPDLNIGTAKGASADRELIARVAAAIRGGASYSSVLDGRFTGGYITRHYGDPSAGVHALQLELTWKNYMAKEAAPFSYDAARAAPLQALLKACLEGAVDWAGAAAAVTR
jgi:N-formylglutamate deformylase